MKLVLKYRLEIFLLHLLIFFYFALRLPNLTLQPIFADEAIYIRWAQVMKSEPTLRFLPLSDGKTPLFMWTMMPLFKIISDPLFAGRLLSVISGLLTLLGVYFLSRKIFNKNVAIWASLLYVITPYTVFFDRMALVDSMLAAFSIWSLYFAIWVVQNVRLDLAMILGFILGGGVLAKTPGMINLLILPVTLFTFKRKAGEKYGLLKVLLLFLVSIFIALSLYNALRLGPNFYQLSARNQDYVFSPNELWGRPLDPFIPHFRDIYDWFPKLFTVPVLIFGLVGVGLTISKLNKPGLSLLLWALIPLLIEMAFLKTFTARYLLSSVAPFLIFAAVALTKILETVNFRNFVKIILALLILLPLPVKFNYELLTNPPPKDLPKEERKGYFEDWTAGYGFSEIAKFLESKLQDGKVVLGTEGFFGTLPDGIQIYLDKSDIAIVGSSATISAQIRNAAKDNLTYFLGNKRGLEGSVSNVKLMMEFSKIKPLDNNTPADASVLYQVFADNNQ